MDNADQMQASDKSLMVPWRYVEMVHCRKPGTSAGEGGVLRRERTVCAKGGESERERDGQSELRQS